MHPLPTILALLATLSATNAQALDGNPDPAFGTNGQLVLVRPQQTPGNGTQPTGDLDILADGRFLWTAPLDDGSVWVGRAWRNGSADVTLGSDGNGRIALPGCGLKRNVRLIADSDGGAYLWSNGCMRHVLNNGVLATGFGIGAMPADGFEAGDLAQDPEGGFVLAGREGQLVKVYRFDANGSPDSAFGIAGSVEVDMPSTNGARELNALVIRPDGRILVGGLRGNTHGTNLIVAQLLANGSPDPQWDDDGLVDMTPPAGFNGMVANALALDDDGSLVIAGKGSNSKTGCCILITRLDTSGQVIPAFGIRLHHLSGQPSVYPFFEQRDGLVILPNHRIIIGAISFPFTAPFGHRTQYTLGASEVRRGKAQSSSWRVVQPGNYCSGR
jgi:uncharacterized delta-60 repeat protein